MLVRYWNWLTAFVQGDFGTSYSYQMPVGQMLADKLPVTFLLCHYAPMPFLTIYGISLLPELVKCIFGGVLLRKTNWIRNITLS